MLIWVKMDMELTSGGHEKDWRETSRYPRGPSTVYVLTDDPTNVY